MAEPSDFDRRLASMVRRELELQLRAAGAPKAAAVRIVAKMDPDEATTKLARYRRIRALYRAWRGPNR